MEDVIRFRDVCERWKFDFHSQKSSCGSYERKVRSGHMVPGSTIHFQNNLWLNGIDLKDAISDTVVLGS